MQNEFDQPVGDSVDGWTPRPFPTVNDAVGDYCRLTVLDFDRHRQALAKMYVHQTNPSQWTYLGYGPFASDDEFFTWLKSVSPKAGEDADPLFFTILTPPPNSPHECTTVNGMTSYLRIDRPQGAIEIGHIHFSKAIQRTPAATEANFLLMCRVFDELGYRRLEWKCDSLNERSCNAARRLGFTPEGTFRNARVYKGRNRDTSWFSITDQEWPAVKQAIASWLAKDNFDKAGKQKNRLSTLLVK